MGHQSKSTFALDKSITLVLRDTPVLRLVSFCIASLSVVALSALIANSFHSASADATLIGGLVSTPDPAISASLNNADLSAIVQPGSFSSLSNTLTVSTSYPTGYSISLSASSANIDHSAGSSTGSILATAGTFASPSALSSSSGNAWGYAIDQNTTSSNANTVVNGFSSSYSAPTASLNWASANTTGTTIKATNQAANNDTTPVYYGVNTTSNLTAGTYTDTVTLSSIANTGNIVAPTITSISPNSGSADGGETVTITGTNFAINGASVTSAVKIGGNNCTNVQIYQDGATQYLTCTTPAGTADTTANVTVTNWIGTATLTNGYTYEASTRTITYNANGGTGTVPSPATVNPGENYTVEWPVTTNTATVTRTIHSDNVGDDGIATSNSATNTDQTKTVTIDGASTLSLTLYYDTEGISYDWVAVYEGADSNPSTTNDATQGSNGNISGKLGGNKSGYTTNYTTWNMRTFTINSDTVKIHFKTDGTAGSYISYGYYAIVTGEAQSEVLSVTKANSAFMGWNTESNGTGTNYARYNSFTPSSNTTLYANWSTTPVLMVDPAGGSVSVTPSGSSAETISAAKMFTGASGSTVTLGTPTKADDVVVTGPTYTVSYNANGGTVGRSSDTFTTGETTSYTFKAWTKSNPFSGTWSSPTYTYPSTVGNDALTATYNSETTTNHLTLPRATPPSPTQYFKGWYTAAMGGTLVGKAGASYIPSSNTTIYAQYAVDPMLSITTMQDANLSTACTNAPTYEDSGLTYTLTDTRGDGAGHTQTYLVRKLKDTKCWMVQNLNLTLSTGITLTSDNTNLATGTTFTPTNNTDTTLTSWGAYNNATDVDKTRSYEPGDKWCTGTTAGSNQTCSTTQGSADATAHIGNYYNWSAATAGSGTYAMTSGNASYSICPKGWRLPTGGSSGELNNLITTQYGISSSGAGSAALRSAPLSFILGGHYNYSGGVNGQGSYGSYWSSAANSSNGAYSLDFNSSNVSPTDSNYKASGGSVRCVAQ